MAEEHIVVPTKDQVKVLLNVALQTCKIDHIDTIGALLGMKLVDSFLPKFPNEPEWGYEGLKKFCEDNGLDNSDTLIEALQKLN